MANHGVGPHLHVTILVLTPTDGDAAVVCHVLEQGGFHGEVCEDLVTLAAAVAREPAAIILAQEALVTDWNGGGDGRLLAHALKAQPEWSDVPIILLATAGATEMGAWDYARALDPVGNISILERPLRRTTLLNAVAVATRARERQFQLRTILAQREDAYQQVRESERSVRTLTDNAPEVLARFDRGLRHVFVNAAVARATGRAPEEFIGKTNRELGMPAHLCELWDGTLEHVFRTAEPRSLDFSLDTPEGTRWYTSQVVAEFDEAGRVAHVISSCSDITDRKVAEQKLARHREDLQLAVEQRTAELAASTVALHTAERLASLGNLAAGLGHDIANLTLPIRARLGVLQATCTTPETRDDFAAITQALDHLSNLSAGMRLMAMDPERVGASTPAADMAAWFAETSQVWRATLGQNVKLECTAPRGVGVNVPRHRLAQAVFNLVQNAGEAMAGQAEGTVWVQAQDSVGPSGEPVVRLTIRDNGPGMPPEVAARCFEPYFSTKGRAIATGMGLGMVRGIVESAGGHITVKSVLGEGTTFTLTLPAIGPVSPVAADPARTAALSVQSERTASLAQMFLGHLSFNVVKHKAASAPDAAMWVVEAPEPALVAAYLDRNPAGRVVALDQAPPLQTHGREPPRERDARERVPGRACNDHADRIILVGASPKPSVLRDAISAASRAAHVPH